MPFSKYKNNKCASHIDKVDTLSCRKRYPPPFLFLIWLLGLVTGFMSSGVYAVSDIEINGTEKGVSLGDNVLIWYDPEATLKVDQVEKLYQNGDFFQPGNDGFHWVKSGGNLVAFSINQSPCNTCYVAPRVH